MVCARPLAGARESDLHLGLRYEFYPLMSRCCGKGIERYDPATNNVYLGGRGNVPNDVGVTVSHKLFAPRAGLAYRLGDKTVIRSGYGLNYDPIPFSRALARILSSHDQLRTRLRPIALLRPVRWPPVFRLSSARISPPALCRLPGNASERSPWAGELHRGYVQSWNFTVERRLPLELVTSVGYVGQHHPLACRSGYQLGYPGSGTTGLAVLRSLRTNRADQHVGWLPEFELQLSAGGREPLVFERLVDERRLHLVARDRLHG